MSLSFTKIKETCLYIDNIAKTKAFYHGKLGLPVVSEVGGSHIFFRAGESMLLCFLPEYSRVKKVPPPHYGRGQLHFAFECEPGDYKAWKAFIRQQGIAIEHEAKWGSLHSFYFRDPDQHSVEIVMKGIWGDEA